MIKPKVALNRFESEVAALIKRDEPEGAVVFYGSSTFTLWGHEKLKEDMAPMTVVNRGFGGSTAHEANHYYDKLVKPLKPKKIVMYEGDNDLASGYTIDEIMEISTNLWEKMREDFPEIVIYILTVKQSIARRELWDKIHELNDAYKAYSKQHADIKIIEHNTITKDKDGAAREEIYIEDMLHFNDIGYRELKELIKKSVD